MACYEGVKKINPAATFPTLIVENAVVGFDESNLKKLLGIGQSDS